MSYASILNEYIKKSGKTLDQISSDCAKEGVTVHPTYISKLRLGKRPAPSEEITRALAKSTGGDPDKLLAEANLGKLTDAQKEAYETYIKNQMLINFTLDKISDKNGVIYPFLHTDMDMIFTFNELFEEAPHGTNLLDREELSEFLSDPRNNQDLVTEFLESVNKLSNSPKVIFEKLKESTQGSSGNLLDFYSVNDQVDKIHVGSRIKIPVIGTVTAGPNGLAYDDFHGEEWADEDGVQGGEYFYLRVRGDSMIGEGILPGDLALVRETPEVENGDLAVVIVNGEEGTLKRIYKTEGGMILQSANPMHQPRIITGQELSLVRIVGKVKETKRRY
ncbi:LexA family protein [Paenibacillus rhizophilus]|uniref:Peptidase S24/S26A/S26B/S26C domain-containing protein n=1 Tax=Paenibacillus rhizophilus TaxID=1850366 RepID=A0A3N9P168_9BACL|nr:S24 family peptidase [Paenibacillus rhizophilus]RQW09928.1 hypothetical protein EH198_17765 [Paenibacillus rhizophilus]